MDRTWKFRYENLRTMQLHCQQSDIYNCTSEADFSIKHVCNNQLGINWAVCNIYIFQILKGTEAEIDNLPWNICISWVHTFHIEREWNWEIEYLCFEKAENDNNKPEDSRKFVVERSKWRNKTDTSLHF